jgi:hypothetical protein
MKDCPWCETSDHLFEESCEADGFQTTWIACMHCGCAGPKCDGLDQIEGETAESLWNAVAEVAGHYWLASSQN